jgi:hypothetical protein
LSADLKLAGSANLKSLPIGKVLKKANSLPIGKVLKKAHKLTRQRKVAFRYADIASKEKRV